jgi:hypothetical protein
MTSKRLRKRWTVAFEEDLKVKGVRNRLAWEGMQEDCIGSQVPQRRVVVRKKKLNS